MVWGLLPFFLPYRRLRSLYDKDPPAEWNYAVSDGPAAGGGSCGAEFFLDKYERLFYNQEKNKCLERWDMVIQEQMTLEDKLNILSDAAKYDVACTSSGHDRKGDGKGIGNCISAGICHSFSGDGRCITLLKILFTNECVFDCKYCINRSSNDVPRASFTPEEVCKLTIEFYRRNYIEGLFLSSGILHSPNYTMGLLYETVYRLRRQYAFQGYVHLKGIPGASAQLVEQAGYLADRMSVNLEFPTAEGLKRLAPHKNRKSILEPMRRIQLRAGENKQELMACPQAPRFVPAGQSTQMIIGASGESDYQILSVAESLYEKFALKRVFYSAFVQVNEDLELPAPAQGPPLLREHRLYQADWLLRFYGFRADELLSPQRPNFNVGLDPKCDWALGHLERFPVEVNRADYYTLLRVPGIGNKSARKILGARRYGSLDFQDLKKMGVVLKRAVYFITCSGKMMFSFKMDEKTILEKMMGPGEWRNSAGKGREFQQLSLFEDMGLC